MTHCIYTGLSPYEKITVAIAAKTVVGWGPYSQFHAFSTLEAGQLHLLDSYIYIEISCIN